MDKDTKFKCLVIKIIIASVIVVIYWMSVLVMSAIVFKDYRTNLALYKDATMITTESEFTEAVEKSDGSTYFCEVEIEAVADVREYYDDLTDTSGEIVSAMNGEYSFIRLEYQKLVQKTREVEKDGKTTTETYFDWDLDKYVVYNKSELDIYGVSIDYVDIDKYYGVTGMELSDDTFDSTMTNSFDGNYVSLGTASRLAIYTVDKSFKASIVTSFSKGAIVNPLYISIDATNQEFYNTLVVNPAGMFWAVVLVLFLIVLACGVIFVFKYSDYKISKSFKLGTVMNFSAEPEAVLDGDMGEGSFDTSEIGEDFYGDSNEQIQNDDFNDGQQ